MMRKRERCGAVLGRTKAGKTFQHTESGTAMRKTYRIGIIGRTGKGDYGHDIDKAWSDIPNLEVVAVADDNKDGLAAVAKRLNVKQTFSDYRELLDKAKPDIVAIATRWIDQH